MDQQIGTSPGTSRPGLSVHEAAIMLGVSPNTVRRWCATGKLRSGQVPRPQGYAVRVYLDGQGGQIPGEVPVLVPPGEVPRQVPPTSRVQVPADLERAEAMAAYTRSLLEPLVARLAEQEAIIRDQAEELGRLRERVANYSEAASEKGSEPPPVPEPLPPTPNGGPSDLAPGGAKSPPWWRRWWACALL